MFYCEACRQKRNWPESWGQSYGRCEVCGNTAICNDTPSSQLPKRPAPEVKAPAAPAAEWEDPMDAAMAGQRRNCIHSERVPWDCFCTYGPPSCQSCKLRSKCTSCGELFEAPPNVSGESPTGAKVAH